MMIAIFVVSAVAIFVFAAAASAQEEAVDPEIGQAAQAEESMPEAVMEPTEATVPEPAVLPAEIFVPPPARPLPPEVVQDISVAPEDFGATDPRVLPDSPFYTFKRWGRAVRRFFIREPAARAEEDLRVAVQKLLEAGKLAELRGEKAAGKIESAVREAEFDLERLRGAVPDIRNADPERAERFRRILADRVFKMQRLFDRIEELVPGEVLVRIRILKEQALEHTGEVLTGLDDPERLAERLSGAAEAQRGSEFKHFKNLEVLRELEDQVPEEAREAIRRAQENGLRRLKEDIESAPIQEREKFGDYVRYLPGDAVIHFELVDTLRTEGRFAPDFLPILDDIKAEVAAKFSEQFERFADFPETCERMSERFRLGTLEGLRASEELRGLVPAEISEVIGEAQKEGMKRMREKFGDDPEALRASEVVKKAMDNPDAVDVALLERLRENSPPERQDLISRIEDDSAKRIAEEFQQRGEEFGRSFTDPNVPQALLILEDLRERLPLAAEGIELAIEAQLERFEERIRTSDDLETLQIVGGTVRADERLRNALESRDPQIIRKIDVRIEDLLMERAEEAESAVSEQEREPSEARPLPFGPASGTGETSGDLRTQSESPAGVRSEDLPTDGDGSFPEDLPEESDGSLPFGSGF